jgi:cysteine-rich repeat protein
VKQSFQQECAMHKVATVLLLVVIIVPAVPSGAVDLNGRWRFETGGFPPATIVTITQTGSSLSIPWVVPYTGTIGSTGADGFTSYSVSWTDGTILAGFGGRITPSGNLLDGRGAAVVPPNLPTVGRVVATRCSCFDGNSSDGDGCNDECQVEPCWTCAGDPSVCTPTADGGACEDGAPCTSGETCTSGVCGGGAPIVPCFDLSGPWTRHYSVPGLGIESHTMTTIIQVGTDLRIDGYLGTIDLATGAFNLRQVNFNLFCSPFDPLIGSIAVDGLTYSATGSTQEPIPFAPDHCDQFDASEIGDHCGDGDLDGLEPCDDGNLASGDGCSPVCQVEQCYQCSGTPSVCAPAAGDACDDDNSCTIADMCAGDGSCSGTPDIGAACDDGNLCTTGEVCGGDAICGAGAPVMCGECHVCDDALGCVVDPGAACDDGNACTSTSFCQVDGSCLGSGGVTCEPCFSCDVALGCVAQPRPVCKSSVTPSRSLVHIENAADDARDRFIWRWKNGADVAIGELGNLTSAGNDVSLCAYDESSATPSLAFRATIPGGSQWLPTGSGFRYKDYSAAADGMTGAALKAGDGGRANARLKGRGIYLSGRPHGLPDVPLPLPLRIQLQGPALCLETRHDSSGVLKNDQGVFKAKGTP